MRFIDLFAGLGGFHAALGELGHECVFSSEINPSLRELYSSNFGIDPYGDIKNVPVDTIPIHDILCAGFPCQPFSKAGVQLGIDCPQWGDLFEHVVRILDYCKPTYFILENVPNLLNHNNGKTWKAMKVKLESHNYNVTAKVLSPHMFGIPQVRERAIVIGSKNSLENFVWPGKNNHRDELDIRSILTKNPTDSKKLPDNLIKALETWQRLFDLLPKNEELPSFPIWAMEFGATYPYKGKSPYGLEYKINRWKGALGQSMQGMSPDQIYDTLPVYARTKQIEFPKWKKTFIYQNRNFYKKNKHIIDTWIPEISSFAPSFQKFEWNWKGGSRDIWSTLIQFRASGIRAKRPTVSPSLVALTTSQVPVIPWEKRYMTIHECACLQSMSDLPSMPDSRTAAYKALGNAVNVTVIQEVASNLISPKITNASSDLVKKSNNNLHSKSKLMVRM